MNVVRQIFYQGRVQGVGFRYTVKQLAAGYEVTGWVRNLADGRVELVVRGEQPEIEIFLEAIAQSQLRQHIRARQEGDPPDAAAVASGFEIRHG